MNVLTTSPLTPTGRGPSWVKGPALQGPCSVWEREREPYGGNELVPSSGVLTGGGFGAQGGLQSVCAALVEEVCLLFQVQVKI